MDRADQEHCREVAHRVGSRGRRADRRRSVRRRESGGRALYNCAGALLLDAIAGCDALAAYVTAAIGESAAEDAEPFIGWVARAIGCLADVASMIETSVEVARSPATMALSIVRTMDMHITVAPGCGCRPAAARRPRPCPASTAPLGQSVDPKTPTIFANTKLPYAAIGLNWSCLDLTGATIIGLPTALAGLNAPGGAPVRPFFPGL